MVEPTSNELLAALQKREAFFRKVLQDAGDITSVLSPDGRRVYISSGVNRILGFSEEEGLAITVAESTHPDDQGHVLEVFRRVLSVPGSREKVRFRQRRKDGSWCTVDAYAHNACDDPDVGGVVVNTRDVSEQVTLQAQYLQAQKLESLARLAGGVAHDFNNLLTIILSGGEQLQGLRLGEGAQYVEEIMSAADRARTLTRQLLGFARREVVRPVPLSLTAQVRVSETILRRLAGEGVELVTELEPGLWPVLCDAGQVDQVLFNLVVNARDAITKGGRITVQTQNLPGRDGGPDAVRLVVRDTGTGIAPEVLPHVFEPFFTTKPPGQGTGLGLATVHGIVEQHGGTVRVESSRGAGSAFVVQFPRTFLAASRAEPPKGLHQSRGDEHVLVVEDEPRIRQLVVSALSEAGYRVTSAGDGEAAFRRLADPTLPVDLLVTDVVLPVGDGLAVARYARERWPGVPVLFTSGYPADRLGADGLVPADIDFLPKPYTPSVLLQRVRAALDSRPKATAS